MRLDLMPTFFVEIETDKQLAEKIRQFYCRLMAIFKKLVEQAPEHLPDGMQSEIDRVLAPDKLNKFAIYFQPAIEGTPYYEERKKVFLEHQMVLRNLMPQLFSILGNNFSDLNFKSILTDIYDFAIPFLLKDAAQDEKIQMKSINLLYQDEKESDGFLAKIKLIVLSAEILGRIASLNHFRFQNEVGAYACLYLREPPSYFEREIAYVTDSSDFHL